MVEGMLRRSRPIASKAVAWVCLALAVVASGFLLFGEFGGWYYAEGDVRTTTVYDYDNDRYDVRHTVVGVESWDSDGLFTEVSLIAPLTIAVVCLTASIPGLLRVGFGRHDDGRRAMTRTALLAGVATLTIAVWSIVYASSMGEVTDWWFGSAFYAGLINALLLTVIALGSLLARGDLAVPS